MLYLRDFIASRDRITVDINLAFLAILAVAIVHKFLFFDTPPVVQVTYAGFGGVAPIFIINLWIPLFALSSLLVRLIYLLFRAVEWAQWFLKQGDAHPLKAIGVVATIIVFGSAMVVKEAWTVL
jgi:hypothetical protein